MEATKEEKKREREERERSNSISLILLATSTITLLLHRYISFPFTGCAPVIPFTDPLCSSFPSRNIGFIFPIKIHRNTCIFFPFFPSMVQLSVSYRGRERGSWNRRGKKYQPPPRIALIKTPCISLITQYRFRCLNSDPRATPRFFNLGYENWKGEGKSCIFSRSHWFIRWGGGIHESRGMIRRDKRCVISN